MAYAVVDDSQPPNLSNVPPGPGAFGYLRTQYEFLQEQIPFLQSMKDRYGDAVSYRLGTFRTYQFTDPDLIEEVLLRKHKSFHKDAITHDLEDLLGRGLLTSEGKFWRRQRKLAAPSLQRRQIEAYADWMVDLTEREFADWEDGDEVELHHAMMALTLKIVVKTLFNVEMEDKVEDIGESIDTAMHVFDKYTHTLWRYVPDEIPTHLSRSFDRAVEELDEVVYDLIDKRRASGEEGDDLLWRFLVANDEEGNSMSDKQLRDEVITMFLAGHETTALAITYAWFLMSHHPDVAQRLYDEVDEVLGDRSATVEDVQELTYLEAIVKETLRMYSPAWIIGREPIEDVQIGPYHVPKGTQVLMPQSVIHYDERWFDAPEEFRPERWLGDLEKELPRFAYFPFGGGARICIGNHFAMMESILLIATMAQRFDLENIMTEELRTQPAVTLRPTVPVDMRVHRR